MVNSVTNFSKISYLGSIDSAGDVASIILAIQAHCTCKNMAWKATRKQIRSHPTPGSPLGTPLCTVVATNLFFVIKSLGPRTKSDAVKTDVVRHNMKKPAKSHSGVLLPLTPGTVLRIVLSLNQCHWCPQWRLASFDPRNCVKETAFDPRDCIKRSINPSINQFSSFHPSFSSLISFEEWSSDRSSCHLSFISLISSYYIKRIEDQKWTSEKRIEKRIKQSNNRLNKRSVHLIHIHLHLKWF